MDGPRIKQVIVIRKDLKMRRGKEIAQGAHASMAWLSRRMTVREGGATLPIITRKAALRFAGTEMLRTSAFGICVFTSAATGQPGRATPGQYRCAVR